MHSAALAAAAAAATGGSSCSSGGRLAVARVLLEVAAAPALRQPLLDATAALAAAGRAAAAAAARGRDQEIDTEGSAEEYEETAMLGHGLSQWRQRQRPGTAAKALELQVGVAARVCVYVCEDAGGSLFPPPTQRLPPPAERLPTSACGAPLAHHRTHTHLTPLTRARTAAYIHARTALHTRTAYTHTCRMCRTRWPPVSAVAPVPRSCYCRSCQAAKPVRAVAVALAVAAVAAAAAPPLSVSLPVSRTWRPRRLAAWL